jgi:hypothetical protein
VGVGKKFGIRLGEEAALDDLGLKTSGGTWNLADRRRSAVIGNYNKLSAL